MVREAFLGATILRPSLVFGPEDHLFNRFASMARVMPFMPVICGDTRFQPVYVGDVADAVMAALAGRTPPAQSTNWRSAYLAVPRTACLYPGRDRPAAPNG